MSPEPSPLQKIFQLCGTHSSCRGCGAKIWWLTTKNGKKMPFTPEGRPHWEDCVKREEFRKP